MNGSSLAKLYDQFRPQERFALYLAALARGDETEAQRLLRTCPVLVYRETDGQFSDRVVRSEWLALAVMADTQRLLGWLDLLAVLHPLLDADPGSDTHGAALVCEKAEQMAAARIRATWEAFQDACRERVGVEASILLRAHGIPLEEHLAKYAAELAAVERDAELYGEYRETVAAVWAQGGFA